MKRTILLLTLTSLAGVSFAEEYIQPDPLAKWENGEWNTADSTNVSTDGNWTMRLSLNASALIGTFKPSDPPITGGTYTIADNTVWKGSNGKYIASDTLGKGLFSLSGDAYQKRGGQDRTLYNNQNTTFVMGWGNDWYSSSADNGVAQGLQLGFTHLSYEDANEKTYDPDGGFLGIGADRATLDNGIEVRLDGTRVGYDMGEPILSFDVYRADTKLQNADGWTIEETGAGAATVDTLDSIVDIAEGVTIKAADLVIVHSTDGAVESTESFTTLYLTVTFTDGKTLRYMAEIDDTSTTSAGVGTLLGGSAYYDIDNFTIGGIEGINNNLIDYIEVYDKSLWVTNEGKVMPEPTTATLSLMALAALAARRRRR